MSQTDLVTWHIHSPDQFDLLPDDQVYYAVVCFSSISPPYTCVCSRWDTVQDFCICYSPSPSCPIDLLPGLERLQTHLAKWRDQLLSAFVVRLVKWAPHEYELVPLWHVRDLSMTDRLQDVPRIKCVLCNSQLKHFLSSSLPYE